MLCGSLAMAVTWRLRRAARSRSMGDGGADGPSKLFPGSSSTYHAAAADSATRTSTSPAPQRATVFLTLASARNSFRVAGAALLLLTLDLALTLAFALAFPLALLLLGTVLLGLHHALVDVGPDRVLELVELVLEEV